MKVDLSCMPLGTISVKNGVVFTFLHFREAWISIFMIFFARTADQEKFI